MSSIMVSVICPVYNSEAFIQKCLDGMFSQITNFKYEILLFDDASKDYTPSIISTYHSTEKILFSPIISPVNILSTKHRFASELYLYPSVIGKYVAVCEGDDYWTDPLKLQKQVDFLESHTDCTMCMHPGEIRYEQEPGRKQIYPPPNQHAYYRRKGYVPLKDMLRSNAAITASVMYRWKYYGDAFTKAFPPEICPGDWYMHLLHAKDGRIGYLPDVMSVYRKHSAGIYTSLEQNEAAFFRKHKESELAFYDAVFRLYSDRAKETELWSETYRRYLNRMLECFLATHDEESLIWFWNRFPGRFERMLALNYFKSPVNNMLERIGRIIVRMGLKEEGFRKTIHRLLHKEPLP